MFLIRRIIEKIKHAHAYDNSELDDLIKDILTRQPLSLMQKIQRKMKYAFKTLVYFITVFAVIVILRGNAFASPDYNEGGNDWTPLMWLLGICGLLMGVAIFGMWRSGLSETTFRKIKNVSEERHDPYIPPPLPRKKHFDKLT